MEGGRLRHRLRSIYLRHDVHLRTSQVPLLTEAWQCFGSLYVGLSEKAAKGMYMYILEVVDIGRLSSGLILENDLGNRYENTGRELYWTSVTDFESLTARPAVRGLLPRLCPEFIRLITVGYCPGGMPQQGWSESAGW